MLGPIASDFGSDRFERGDYAVAGSALDAAVGRTVGRAVAWTWARQRQQFLASAWLMAPHVEQMVSRMLMR